MFAKTVEFILYLNIKSKKAT